LDLKYMVVKLSTLSYNEIGMQEKFTVWKLVIVPLNGWER